MSSLKRAVVFFVVAVLLFASTPNFGKAETKRRDFHYRTRGMVRLLIFWIGKDDVGGGRVSLLESQPEQGDRSTSGIEVLFGSRPDRVPGGHNRWGYAKELADWRRGDGSGAAVLDSVRFEGFMTLAHEASLDEVQNADTSEALYEGTVSRVERSRSEAKLWRFRGPPGDTYQSPGQVLDESVTVRSSKPYLERTLVNEDTYEAPYGFLTALNAFVQEVLPAETSDSIPISSEGEKNYVHNARPYTLYLEKAKLRKRFKLSNEHQHERVLELQMKTKNWDVGTTHRFTLFLATKGVLRGVPLRIEDKLRWWLKVRLDLDEEYRPPNEIPEITR